MKKQFNLLKCEFVSEKYYVNFANKLEPVIDEMSHKNSNDYLEVADMQDDAPPYFVLYVTDLCNMDCEYCFNKMGDVHRTNGKPEYSLDELVAFFLSLEVKEIYIRFFGGEPLINTAWIKECVNRLNLLDITFHYNVFTNVTLLSDEFIEFAVGNNFQFFCSLGGENEEYKGKRFGDVVTSNLQKLTAKTTNIIGSVVWDPNGDLSIMDTVNHYRKIGVKFITFILTWGGDYNQKNYFNVQQQLHEFAKSYIDLFLQHETWHLFMHPFIDYIIALITDKKGHLDACACGKNLAAIATDGTIYPCQSFSSHKEFEVGNIRKLLWNKRFQDINVEHISFCNECEIKYVCKGRCYFNNYMKSGSVTKTFSERCVMEKMIIACSAYIVKELQKNQKEYSVFKKIIDMELKENVIH